MEDQEACCTCAKLLASIDPQTEKPRTLHRRLQCCGRIICTACAQATPRFQTYCPFCQISSAASSLPQGLKNPPEYRAPESTSTTAHPPTYGEMMHAESLPPPYTARGDANATSQEAEHPDATDEKATLRDAQSLPAEDVLHFINHETDTVTSLAFRYGVPLAALRKANNLTSDHLLLARRTVVIPSEYYAGGVSLSPRPVEGEAEERRKSLIRRFMVVAKVAEYDMALLYLKQTEYDLDAALEMYTEDEKWEKDHPVNGKGKGSSHADVVKRRFTGQRCQR